MPIELRVVEEHSECLFFIQRLLERGKLPLEGFKMIHYDPNLLYELFQKIGGKTLRKRSSKKGF